MTDVTDSLGRDWRWRRFEALAVHDLQRIHAARQQVFAIEQQCIFQDADACDERAWHLACWSPGQGEPLAYARVLDPGVKYAEPSIGRVLTTAGSRGMGLGRALMARAVSLTRFQWPGTGIRISAQARLSAFYGGMGFVEAGAPYLEDGIDHVEMVLAPATHGGR